MERQEFDLDASRGFLTEEIARLDWSNRRAATVRSASASLWDVGRRPIVVACMDERNALTEEALGLDPSLVLRFASGGGKIGADDFLHLFGSELVKGGAGVTVFLTTHEVVGKPELGCAAFKCDLAEQERYFVALRRELAARLPQAWVHALSYDTATGGLRSIELDPRDLPSVSLVAQGGSAPATRREVEAHGGYGIYVGDFYRAWVDGYNRYFHISAGAPSLRGDLDIALAVMLHHSTVDLTDKPIMVLMDRTTAVDNAAATERHRKADAAVMDFLRSPEAAPLMESGRLRLVDLETDPTTWSGRIVTELG